MAKAAEVKSLNAQLMQIKSEINKYEEQLKEYKMYKAFLDRLIPENIRLEREAASTARKEAKRKAKQDGELFGIILLMFSTRHGLI